MSHLLLRLSVWFVCAFPGALWAQGVVAGPAALQGGLTKPISVLSGLRDFLLIAGGILVTISLIGLGIAMSFYHKKWHDIQGPVIGGIVIGFSSAFAGWLIAP